MVDIWIEGLGLFAGFLGVVAWIPQIREVWIEEQQERGYPCLHLV